MTGITSHGRLALLMTVDAPFHFQRLLNTYDLLLGDITVTTPTLNLRCRMCAMAEEDKARQLMDELPRDLPLSHVRVAALALRQSGKTRSIRPLDIRVAERALQRQRRVLLVIERPVLRPQT